MVTMIATVIAVGCSPKSDMQGFDPNEYYRQHPVENTVETRHALYTMVFKQYEGRLSADSIDDLNVALAGVEPMAAESVRVSLSPLQMQNPARKEYISKLLRSMGYARKIIHFDPSDAVPSGEADIDITYAVVVSPKCPDWRTSPTTTNSNFDHHLGCSAVTNLGLQVADPHDLASGSGDNTPDTARTTKVISDYKSGLEPGASSEEGGGGDAAAAGGGLGAAAAGLAGATAGR